jgi:hypothetical protein
MEGGELFDQIIKRADDHLAFTEKGKIINSIIYSSLFVTTKPIF